MKHHPTLSPSSLPIKKICTRYQSGEVGQSAIRGTVQHTALEDAFKKRDISVKLKPEELSSVEYGYCSIVGIVESAGLKMKDGQSEVEVSILDKEMNEITFGTVDFGIGDMIFDYKSGEIRNYREQMVAYAVGWGQLNGLEQVTVFEVYGKKEYTKPAYVVNVETGLKEILEIKERIEQGLAPVVNEYCGWCQKKGSCPARTGEISAVISARTDKLKEINLDPCKANAEQLGTMKSIVSVITAWCKDVDAEVKSRLEAGMPVDGYSLKDKQGNLAITDVAKAVELSGLKPEVFVLACSASLPKLSELLSEADGITKKSARQLIESRLASVLSRGEPSKSVVADK